MSKSGKVFASAQNEQKVKWPHAGLAGCCTGVESPSQRGASPTVTSLLWCFPTVITLFWAACLFLQGQLPSDCSQCTWPTQIEVTFHWSCLESLVGGTRSCSDSAVLHLPSLVSCVAFVLKGHCLRATPCSHMTLLLGGVSVGLGVSCWCVFMLTPMCESVLDCLG